MNVLSLGRFYPASFGGIERHIELLHDNLGPDVNVDSIVVSRGLSHKEFMLHGRRIIQVPCVGVVASTPICPTLYSLVRKLSREKKYDVVHLHFPNPMAHFAAYSLPKPTKLVITWHSDIVRKKKLLRLYFPFLKHIVRRADALVAASPKNFESFEQLKLIGDPKKFHVVPFAIDPEPFLEVSIERIQSIKNQYADRFIIFALGRHVYYKGFEYLITAMQWVNNAVLLLGGQGPLTSILKKQVEELNLEEKVKFLGSIEEADLPAYYHAADVFCLPSIKPSEAYGLVQLEAMACKKPVICCELNNGVTFVNQHEITGVTVPPHQPHAFAEAIIALQNNPRLRQTFGENGFKRVTETLSISSMVKAMESVYYLVNSTI